MTLQPRTTQPNGLADLINGGNQSMGAGAAVQNSPGKNSQTHCMVCEFITRMQILRELSSPDDNQFCPLHFLEVCGYVTRSGYGKKSF